MDHRKPYIALGISGQIIAMALVPLISVQHGLSNFAILALIASTSMALELSIGNIGLLVVLSMVGRIFGVISNS